MLCKPNCVLNVPASRPERKLCTPSGTQRGMLKAWRSWRRAPKADAAAGARASASSARHSNCSAIRASTAPAWTSSARRPRFRSARPTSTSPARTNSSPNTCADSIPTSRAECSTAPTSRPANDSSLPSRSPRPGHRTSRQCAPTSRRPSKSTTLSTPHANTHATTRKPSPRGSPKPPAKPAPPTPNSSANSWRCSSTAPRPAPGSSTPNPSPPPPPSPPSSSTTPSPRQPSDDRGSIRSAPVRVAGERQPGQASFFQPAVSHQLAALERETGTSLLRREPRGGKLTPAGRAAVADARRAIEAAASAVRSARAADEAAGGSLWLACAQSLMSVLAPVIREWHHRHPEVAIGLHESTSAGELHGFIDSDEADVVLMPTPVPDRFTATVVADEEIVLAAPADHPIARQPAVRVQDLDGV